MNEFWDFAGRYWWLIFPLMAVAGGFAQRWERASRRRHERRLETLRLKAQLKTAELEARALDGGRGRRDRHDTQAREPGQPAPAPPDEVLERLFAEHDEITARWLDYELDVAKLIA